MKTFERGDVRFVEKGVDDLRRGIAIRQLIRKRRLLFWCAVTTTVCAVSVALIGRSSGGGALLGFAAAIHWLLVFKSESELRLLMMIGRLKAL
jgi:hypothetical protein